MGGLDREFDFDRELDFVLLYCLPFAFYAYNLVVIRMTMLTEYIALV